MLVCVAATKGGNAMSGSALRSGSGRAPSSHESSNGASTSFWRALARYSGQIADAVVPAPITSFSSPVLRYFGAAHSELSTT